MVFIGCQHAAPANLRRDSVYSQKMKRWRGTTPARLPGWPALLLPLLLAAPGSAAAQGDTFEETVALEAGGSLSIEASGGSVLLLAWERPQVAIEARIEAPADVDSDYARDIVAATRIEVRATAGSVSIRSDFSEVERRGFFDRRRTLPDVHYEINAPRELMLDIALERGAGTTLRGFEGQVGINSERSDLNLVGAGRHAPHRPGPGPTAGQRLLRLAPAERGSRHARGADAPERIGADHCRPDERGAARRAHRRRYGRDD